MGNTSSRESRHESQDDSERPTLDTRVRSRHSFRFTGHSTSAPSGSPLIIEHRETKAERAKRRREQNLKLREQQRAESMDREHVDGGYLVTMGTYTGIEDFNKQIVRHLQIERKLAPFWRGLNTWEEDWTEAQLIAAAKGFPIPPPDAPPPEDLGPQFPPASSSQPQSQPQSSTPHTPSPGPHPPRPASSHKSLSFRTRDKAQKAFAAALNFGSRNNSQAEISLPPVPPREVALPYNPFYHGQRIEVHLYKQVIDCDICLLSYPPYLNYTRCCGQYICSECFVQIKRADPHYPDHHNEDPSSTATSTTPGMGGQPDEPESLISEPTSCPFCMEREFGVAYDPPPFRRGLVYDTPHLLGGAASSSANVTTQNSPEGTSQTSPSGLTPGSEEEATPAPHPIGRRRTISLSATAPNVITTDRIRPDWVTKFNATKARLSRRAAQATALHTAAFLVGENESSHQSGGGGGGLSRQSSPRVIGMHGPQIAPSHGPHASSSPGAMANLDLEDMMLREALRQSLRSEEERKKKEEEQKQRGHERRGIRRFSAFLTGSSSSEGRGERSTPPVPTAASEGGPTASSARPTTSGGGPTASRERIVPTLSSERVVSTGGERPASVSNGEGPNRGTEE